jgi:peptidoglycan lytic transglycosylase A
MRWSVLSGGGALLVAAGLLSACAGGGAQNQVGMVPTSFNEIAGWTDDKQDEALAAFRRSCPKLTTSPESKILTDGGQKTVTPGEWK